MALKRYTDEKGITRLLSDESARKLGFDPAKDGKERVLPGSTMPDVVDETQSGETEETETPDVETPTDTPDTEAKNKKRGTRKS
jgi:hypothetical protein